MAFRPGPSLSRRSFGGLALTLAACSRKPPREAVTVGARAATEASILGEIAAQHVARRLGVEVKRDFSFQSAAFGHQGLMLGGIDVLPVEAGWALTQVLRMPAESNREFALNRVREQFGAQFQLELLNPLGYDARFAVFARAGAGLKTLGQAAAPGRSWRLGVTPEFFELREGYGALVKSYRIQSAAPARTFDPAALAQALLDNWIDLAAGRTPEGALADPSFQELTDDRGAFFPNEPALVVRREALQRIPQLRGALSELSGKITLAGMRRMNRAVERERRSAADVAADFLKEMP